MIKRQHILVNGHKWEYLRFGKGEPIVLIHGFVSNAEFLVPFGKILAGKFEVIIPDLPGFGWTKSLKDNTLPNLAIELAGFINALGLGDLCVFGVSFGGTLCLEMAIQDKVKIAKMFLQSPLWERCAIHHNFDTDLEVVLLKIPTGILKKFQHRRVIFLLFKIMNLFRERSNEPSFPRSIWNRVATVICRTDVAFAKQVLNTKDFFNHGQELHKITIPTVLIGCNKDVVIPPDEVKNLKMILKTKCKYVELEECSHAAIVEVPDKLAEIIITNS